MSYVWAGYSATLAGLGAYTAWLLRRARSLARLRQLAPPPSPASSRTDVAG